MSEETDAGKEQRAAVLGMVLTYLYKTEDVTEELIRANIDALKIGRSTWGPNMTDEDFEQVFDDVLAMMTVKMTPGTIIEGEAHRPWLLARNPDWVHWNAYRQYLANEGRSPVVLEILDQTLNAILDHMGDPKELPSWNRRGLVIGEVQSGKTATYLGLIDKSIDVGYKVFILLTGSTESLRQQTQSRIDQGVIGRDSMAAIKGIAENNFTHLKVGIGQYLETSAIVSLTTMTSDFSSKSLQATSIVLGPDKVVIFVTKKNTTVLEHIRKWLDAHPKRDGKIDLPVILIDDEADYASINTNSDDVDPTKTNSKIREILALFSRNSYVGFTATPFANIFINDEVEDDLFPRDFIYGLDAPSNYIGSQTVFSADRDDDSIIVHIDDAEEIFPAKHKKSLPVSKLPLSLEESVRTFFLSNAIRDLRGDADTHRSMLVNVSRYVDVQEQVFRLVESLVAELKHSIQLHAAAFADGRPNATLARLKSTFETQYSDCGHDWPEVLAALPASTRDIRSIIANSRADAKLEQDELSREIPPRQVVVGGDLLSRGLTLEGLTVSYFYRRTAAADTLMQMGRWFGYRDNYFDISRIWMAEEIIGLYSHIADALDELRLELVRMRNQKLTPRQYGLAVRNHPDSLIITARNKMRTAADGFKQVSLRGRAIESYALPVESEILEANVVAMIGLLTNLSEEYGESNPIRSGSARGWFSVKKEFVADFLDSFEADRSALGAIFQHGALSGFVRGAEADDLQTWDVVFMGGSGELMPGPGLPSDYRQPTRAFKRGTSLPVWLVSGQRMRVAGAGDVSTPLASDVRETVRKDYFAEPDAKSGVPDKRYISALGKPLLLVYPIQPSNAISDVDKPQARVMVAVVIAIPGAADDIRNDNVTYKINRVAQRLWFPEIIEGDSGNFEADNDDV